MCTLLRLRHAEIDHRHPLTSYPMLGPDLLCERVIVAVVLAVVVVVIIV